MAGRGNLACMRYAPLIAIALLSSGCMTYGLTAGDPAVTPDRAQHHTLHSIAWGAAGDTIDATGQLECANAGVATVRVQDNFGYTLLNVVTLGFWQPIDVWYTCAVPSGTLSNLEAATLEAATLEDATLEDAGGEAR